MSFCLRPKQVRIFQPGIVPGSASPATGNTVCTAVGTVIPSSQPGAAPLRLTLANTHSPGIGPGGIMNGSFVYRANGALISTPGSIASLIAQADAQDVVLIVNLADSRNHWAPNGAYDPALYASQVRLYQNIPELTSAINRRRVICYAVDEPQIPFFAGSISPKDVNDMGLLIKSIWPGALTVVRIAAKNMTQGWANNANVSGPPPGGWTGIDYGTSQWESRHVPSAGETMTQFYTREKSQLLSVQLGMIPGLNWFDGGNYDQTQEAVNPCWDYLANGSSSGVVVGTLGVSADGTQIPCGTASIGTTETRFMCSPAFMARWFSLMVSDVDAPYVAIWTTTIGNTAVNQIYNQYELQTQFITALRNGITLLNTRSQWNGWRVAK